MVRDKKSLSYGLLRTGGIITEEGQKVKEKPFFSTGNRTVKAKFSLRLRLAEAKRLPRLV